MPGKWMLISEAVCAIGESGEKELLTLLKRGELAARAEKYTHHWIHRKDALLRSEGDSGYRMVALAPTRLIPIAADWWDVCEADFTNNTAHVRWDSSEIAQIGSLQPFKILVEGVIVAAADIERLWPVTAVPAKKGRPPNTGKQKTDTPLIEKMHCLIAAGQANSKADAARRVLDDKWTASDVRRLSDRYKGKYGE
jgi:hypothetical protein